MIKLTETTAAPKTQTSVALGLFDGLHKGHRAVIEAAISGKEQGLAPAVFTFTSDALPKKNAQAIVPFQRKLAMLEDMGVQYVYTQPFSRLCTLSPPEFVEQVLVLRLNAAAATCGEDFRFGKDASGDSELLTLLCEKHGISVTIVPAVRHGGAVISSTFIRALLREGEVAAANELLGYPYTIYGEVVHGKALGRTIGFPTINQEFEPDGLIPRFGVYASITTIDGIDYTSITNIGIKPTVTSVNKPLAETYIVNYNGDLYGKTIPVRLTRFIRAEERFDGLDTLKEQITQDIMIARRENTHE